MSMEGHALISRPLDLTTKVRPPKRSAENSLCPNGHRHHNVKPEPCLPPEENDSSNRGPSGHHCKVSTLQPTQESYIQPPKCATGAVQLITTDSDPKPMETGKPVTSLPFRKRPYHTEDETLDPSCNVSHTVKETRRFPELSRSVKKKPDGSGCLPQTTQRLPPPVYSEPGNRLPVSYIDLIAVRRYPLLNTREEEMERLSLEVATATRQDDDGDTALHIAVVQEQEAVVHRLIHTLVQARKDLDIYNNLLQTPLHLAVITNQASSVKALLCGGADPGALDRHGQTAAHLCCEHGLSTCLSLVLSHPASQSCLKARNYEGLTPLHLAVQNEKKELVRLLLASGADIDAVDFKSGRSPLIHAVENNSLEMINFLIESGSNVNAQSYSGNTALHSACGRGQVEAVRALLRNGADSSLKNYHNDTALMVAKNKKVTDVLRGKGSRSQNQKSLDSACDSPSPQRRTSQSRQNSTNGSPVQSPRHSRHPSPLATPTPVTLPFQNSPSHSPKTTLANSPVCQSIERHSYCQPPMAAQETEQQVPFKHIQPIMTTDYGIVPFQILPLEFDPYRSFITDTPVNSVIPNYPILHPCIIIPDRVSLTVNRGEPPHIIPGQSRPSSRSSNLSDVSTMSMSSWDKCES